MSTTNVDYDALGLPLLKWILGPTAVIDKNNVYDGWLYDEGLYRANYLLGLTDISEHAVIMQYCGAALLYRLFFGTGETVFRDAARLNVQRWRDGTPGVDDGIEPWYFDPVLLQGWVQTPNDGRFPFGSPSLTGFSNPFMCEAFATYIFENPAGEAAAARKLRDVIRWQAALYWIFYNMRGDITTVDGAREEASSTHWCWVNGVVNGWNDTIAIGPDHGTGYTTITAQQMYDHCRTKWLTHHNNPQSQRPYWAWDFDASLPGDPRYIGNMNLGGTGADIIVKLERYHRLALGAPDSRMYSSLKLHMNWLDFGTAPIIGTANNGSQWLPNASRPPSHPLGAASGATYRYYHYVNPANYGVNGTTPEPEWPLSGHLHSMYAAGAQLDPSSTERDRYLQRVIDMANGLRQHKPLGVRYFNGRHFTEGAKTWQLTFAILNEIGGAPPPGGGGEPPPTEGAIRLKMTGWEWGSHVDCESSLGTVQTSVKRSGDYALQLTEEASPGRYNLMTGVNLFSVFQKVHVRFHINGNPAAPVSWDMVALDNGSKTLGVGIRTTVSAAGVITLQGVNFLGGGLIGGPVTVAQDVWHHLDLKAAIDATSGEVAWRIPGSPTVGGSVVGNTGSSQITHWSLFEAPNTSGLNIDCYFDDAVLDDNLYIAATSILLRRGKSGTPNANQFVKTGGAGIHTVWSEVPPSATNEAHSNGPSATTQTMLVADPAGGVDPVVGNDQVFHVQAQIIAKEIP